MSIDIGKFCEMLLPAENTAQSKEFYSALGFTVTNETDWGLIQMKRGETERISLLPAAWWKKVTRGYVVSDTDALIHIKDQLIAANIAIEDETGSTPPRIGFFDPSGNEFQIIAEK